VTLAPVPSDLESTIDAALGQRAHVGSVVKEAVGDGIANLWFIGCGGSLYASSSAADVMAGKGKSVATYRMNSDEFNYGAPAALGAGSLVVVGSHTGTTAETVRAIDTARSRGVRAVLGITRDPESPLAAKADHAFTYGSKHTVWEPKQVFLAQIAHSVLLASGDETQQDHDAALDAYTGLGGAILSAIAESDAGFAELATAMASKPIIYVLGAGPSEDVARCLSMCYLQEMQWIHSAAFNAGEFFQGAFEMVTEETPVILFLGQDHSRPIAERAQAFLARYTSHQWNVDLASLTLPGLPAAYRAEVGPIVLGALGSRIAQHFEAVTGHDLKTRRYMFKVEY
jgi:fructoselysine 6-phosphate deglycase